MDLSSVPIHQRLDALLEKLDRSEDDFDYQQYVDKRSKSALNAIDPVDQEGLNNEDSETSDYETTNEPVNEPINGPANDVSTDVANENASENANEVSRPVPTNDLPKVAKPLRRDKQIQIEAERTARLNQEMERNHAEDIVPHTVKTRTVDMFLASLSDNEDDGEPVENTQEAEEHRFKELVSSPPRMQGLRSFISKPMPSPHLQGSKDDSDSDLEIIPETKTNRLSKPVKNLLKLSGGGQTSHSDRKLALEKAKLQRLQLKQIADRKAARLQVLKAHGVDVDQVSEQMNEQRKQNAMSAEALFELERSRTEALRKEEYDGSDEDSDFDNSPIIERARKMLSDSEDDDGDDEAQSMELTKTVRDSTALQDDTDDENDEEDLNRVGRTGTQYVPPLDKKALAEMLGMSSGGEEEEEDDDPVENATEEPQEEAEPENWDIVNDQNDVESTVVPDLSGLKSKDLTMSQHLAEVRQRYLDAQAEQRRKELQKKRDQREKSKFLEDQAEESDDEDDGGIARERPADDEEAANSDEDQDAELQELVDHGHVNQKEAELRRQYLEDEKLRDQRVVNKLVEGVHGGFRRKARGENGQFLSDDDGYEDDAAEEQMQQYLKMVEARRKEKLVNSNAGAGKLASNSKASAFFTSISEDLVSRPQINRKTSVQENLLFLRSVEKDHEPPLQHDVDGPLISNSNDDSMGEQSNPVDRAARRHETEQDLGEHSSVLPKVALSVRRSTTLRSSQLIDRSKRGSTYASRISASDFGGAKTVEILQSLSRRSEPQKAKKRFVTQQPAVSQAKRPRNFVSRPANTGNSLFKRNWS